MLQAAAAWSGHLKPEDTLHVSLVHHRPSTCVQHVKTSTLGCIKSILTTFFFLGEPLLGFRAALPQVKVEFLSHKNIACPVYVLNTWSVQDCSLKRRKLKHSNGKTETKERGRELQNR